MVRAVYLTMFLYHSMVITMSYEYITQLELC